MEEEILNSKNIALGRIMDAKSSQDLTNIEIEYLGRNGQLTLFIKQIVKLPKDDRKQIGIIINEAKLTLQKALQDQKEKLKATNTTSFDTTIPGVTPPMGHLHLISQAIQEIADIFQSIGFVRARYPEVEWDFYAFESLNIPVTHPARDTLETYFVEAPSDKKLGEMVLSPQTSSGQVREMHRVGTPPIRMINIGTCYRRQSDISHTPMFHQFEGLVIDRGITIANLKGTLDYFAQQFFGANRKTRLRPYHFQFTEPSFEVDITCDLCNGTSRLKNGERCKMCKAGWLELGGAGMVHPKVLSYGNIDSKIYTGFAFGWGVERVLLMKSGLQIPDLRLLYGSDISFLSQF